uniref:Serpentine receptor class gamma n=1 Tax=Meloidogyne floridensis TaxID=298350 RepID=A0A915NVU2_9BILA
MYSPFLHAWSLGVEMQFYLLAPLYIVINNNFENSSFLSSIIKQKIRPFILYFILILFSFFIQQKSTRTVRLAFPPSPQYVAPTFDAPQQQTYASSSPSTTNSPVATPTAPYGPTQYP